MSMVAGAAVCPKNAMIAPRQACAAAGIERQPACCMPQGTHLLGKPRHSAHGGQTKHESICRLACRLLMGPSYTARSNNAIGSSWISVSVSDSELAVAGRSHHITRTRAKGTGVAPMFHPPGPSKMYPEANQALGEYFSELALEILRRDEILASANPETTDVIETPPEWGRPDEGNPNQPRRPPEYNPPQVGSTYTSGCGCPVTLQHSSQSQPFPSLEI